MTRLDQNNYTCIDKHVHSKWSGFISVTPAGGGLVSTEGLSKLPHLKCDISRNTVMKYETLEEIVH